MKRLWLLLALVMAIPIAAQDTQGKAAYEKLVAEYTAATEAYRAELTALMKTEEYVAARNDRDNKKLAELRKKAAAPDRAVWSTRFQEAAVAYAGTDAAVPFLTWILTNGDGEPKKMAAATIQEKHVKSAALAEFSEDLRYMGRTMGVEGARKLADALIAENPDPVIKANAYFARATFMAPPRGGTISDEDKVLRDADLKMVVELAPNSISALRANAPEFEKTRLQIGMEAPDIVGKDLDGNEFKLSDYRGKVVVIDFWGDW